MDYKPSIHWAPKQTKLKEILFEKEKFHEAMALIKDLHSFAHQSEVTSDTPVTLGDMVCKDLALHEFEIMPTVKDVTIAWNLWHVARIEDLTMNLLVADGPQVFTKEWQEKLSTKVTDTANAMTDPEILSFSKEVNKEALLAYRKAVKERSQKIIEGLCFEDLERKFTKEQAQKIYLEGGVTDHPDSIWLVNFWGRKNVGGILLLPLTRHQAGHLNDCLKLKKKIRNNKVDKR